ncbi:MAG: UDP-2,3-diacylglucosamine diphosphatase [Flavobacteriaceae bacterium]
MRKRRIDIAVISDVHLGNPACRADELLAYLNSIRPKKLILNGDIIDFHNLGNDYFPPAHMKVLKKIVGMASGQTEVIYITGNHDELLRRVRELSIGNICLMNKLALKLDGKNAWFFHGDALDISFQFASWIGKLGSVGYETLIWINGFRNTILKRLGYEKYSLAERIKNETDGAERFIQNFEKTATSIAIENGYDYVVCGHIHKPKKEICESRRGICMYLNSGDWVENLTALEYSFKRWKIYHYHYDKLSAFFADDTLKDMDINELMSSIIDLKAGKKHIERKYGESIND